MTTPGFEGQARVASGTTPTSTLALCRVTVADGSLVLGPADRAGVLVDVPLARVRAHPLGRGGSVVVDVDQQPLLLVFSDHGRPDADEGAAATARRVVDAGRGRARRTRFLRALERGGS